jgi:hypothetical protein
VAKNKYIQGNIVMSNKDLPKIANYADLHLQPVRKLHITVEALDHNNRTIETIQGLSTGGSLSVSANSLIRRAGSLSFVLFDFLLPKEGSILWMTNKIRVYAGIEDLSTSEGTVTHFCLGTFYLSEPQISVTRDSREITIDLEDNMMRWEQKELENKLVIEAGTPLHTAVSSLMNLHGEWNTEIEFTELQVPYKLEFNEGDTILDILTKLRNLYMDWECFYDVDGTFVFRRMDIQKPYGEPIAWRFEREADLITTYKESFTYKNVRNRVVVIGAMDERTGLTPRAEATISLETSPFHRNKIGEKTKVFTENELSTMEQCDAKARYELFKASTFQKQLEINTIPIYYLDGNNVIEVRNPNTNEVEPYIIDAIQIGLGIEEEMSLSCHKLYYNHFEINSSLDKYRESADLVIDGIMNKGWLSLSEKRVRDYYGLEGDGSKVIVRFEYGSKYGTTAYVTGYDNDSIQTLTIDLADFESPIGDSGDIGQTKAEYSDRVLGHEMVHIVMNSAFGVSKTMQMPDWFKEGVAEFIHGADERLKASIVTNGFIDPVKVTGLVQTATDLLNGSLWQSLSDFYSAGYVIAKYIDTKLSAGKDYKTLMASIKASSETGDLAIQNAIVENTDFATFEDFVTNFSNNAENYIKYNISLNVDADEVDTGSIAGSDHRGTVDLSAEQIFNNSLANRGESARGFTVEFDRP